MSKALHQHLAKSATSESVERVIRRAMDSTSGGQLRKTQAAVEAAHQARPDMTTPEILATVRLVQSQ
jgi:hypothetical protein